MLANTHPLAAGCRYLVNGEPTDSTLATAHRGVLRVKLIAKGLAAHTSRPEMGESAIDKLIDVLIDLRRQKLPEDEFRGFTHYTVGLISGGVAPNVVPAHAEAEVMFRTVGPTHGLEPALDALRDRVTIEHILEVPPVHLRTVAGFESAVPFSTDIPFLDAWGEPLLSGRDHPDCAPTEHVAIEELERAVDSYAAIAAHL